jgi:hypothetical protein
LDIQRATTDKIERRASVLAGKINDNLSRRNIEITRQVSNHRDKNQKQRMKQQEIANKFVEDAENNYQSAIEHQKAKEKQLRSIYNTMHKQWMQFKDANAETMNKMAHLKQEEIYKQQDLIENLKSKRLKSISAVEKFKQQQAHKFMLRQEERKLHEEDMNKVHARQKRLATRKKQDIMRKE